jgi:hypothetical protein
LERSSVARQGPHVNVPRESEIQLPDSGLLV